MHSIDHTVVRQALLATAAFRETTIRPLSEAIGRLAALRAATYTAYRSNLGPDGGHLPQAFDEVWSPW